jgi:hypothetical protein
MSAVLSSAANIHKNSDKAPLCKAGREATTRSPRSVAKSSPGTPNAHIPRHRIRRPQKQGALVVNTAFVAVVDVATETVGVALAWRVRGNMRPLEGYGRRYGGKRSRRAWRLGGASHDGLIRRRLPDVMMGVVNTMTSHVSAWCG